MADGRTAQARGSRESATRSIGTVRRRRLSPLRPDRRCSPTGRRSSPPTAVTLEDGTELLAERGDHRFLTNRGWKHVIGTQRGQRPTGRTSRSNNALLGTGRFADPPRPRRRLPTRATSAGMIRGDGHLEVATTTRVRRRTCIAIVPPRARPTSRRCAGRERFLDELEVADLRAAFRRRRGARAVRCAAIATGAYATVSSAVSELIRLAAQPRPTAGARASSPASSTPKARAAVRTRFASPTQDGQIIHWTRRSRSIGSAFDYRRRATATRTAATYVRTPRRSQSSDCASST